MVLVLFGMWWDFSQTSGAVIGWLRSDSRLYEGFSWIAENTENNASVLAWWDYALGIVEIGHRDVVIKGASRKIEWTIAGLRKYPWRWIEYELWYQFEAEERVRDVGRFFISENSSEASMIMEKYNAEYVLVIYPDDVMKFYAIVLAAERHPKEYLLETEAREEADVLRVIEQRAIIKKETVGIKMIYGEEIDGFVKVFDNERVRIYRAAR